MTDQLYVSVCIVLDVFLCFGGIRLMWGGLHGMRSGASEALSPKSHRQVFMGGSHRQDPVASAAAAKFGVSLLGVVFLLLVQFGFGRAVFGLDLTWGNPFLEFVAERIDVITAQR